MKKNILVTGGAGFIGSNFCDHIARQYPEYKITVVDALTYAGSIDNLPEAFAKGDQNERRFWYGNICNTELIDHLVSEADVVVHFAAESHVTRSIYDNYEFFATDVIGTQVIANAILKNERPENHLIHISTSEVYGTAQTNTMAEDHPLNPRSPYAAAKCGADRLVYSYTQTYSLPATILRPFNNYGPKQHLEKVIPRFITSALLGEPMTVHGDGSSRRDYIFVADTCSAIDKVMHATAEQVIGKVFNLCSGVDRSVLEIANEIQNLMGAAGHSVPIEFNPNRLGQVDRHTGDSSRFRKTFCWEPNVCWEAGLKETINWYLENREKWKKNVWMRRVPVTTATGDVEFH
jgi:dTDP-glucose 4,6-dehydratase